MEGQAPAVAALTLGLEISEAEEMLAGAQRDIAVLPALDLFMRQAGEAADVPRSRDCCCANTLLARRRTTASEPAAPGSGQH